MRSASTASTVGEFQVALLDRSRLTVVMFGNLSECISFARGWCFALADLADTWPLRDMPGHAKPIVFQFDSDSAVLNRVGGSYNAKQVSWFGIKAGLVLL